MSENFNFQRPTSRANLTFLSRTAAKIMPDHTLPFGGNQDLFTGKGPFSLCFFRHA